MSENTAVWRIGLSGIIEHFSRDYEYNEGPRQRLPDQLELDRISLFHAAHRCLNLAIP